jgi:uncharacterized protein YecE (DUF72 family)
VEIDSTYYSIPPPHVVASWREKTPPGFIFSAKIPGVITHEKVLKDCQTEFTTFLNNISLLGDRLGPLLLQFPYFNRDVFPSRAPFEKLLTPFLKTLPKEFKFALEIRNKNWISWDFLELLRDHQVAFALVAQAWMPPIDTLAKALDLVTSDFTYVRFIGDRKAIEAKTKRWDKLIEDKTPEMTVWAKKDRQQRRENLRLLQQPLRRLFARFGQTVRRFMGEKLIHRRGTEFAEIIINLPPRRSRRLCGELSESFKTRLTQPEPP